RQTGNVIELSTAVVGVEEACSGIRSLISCVVAALFFSAVFLRRAGPRALLLVGVAPIAFGMNFTRSLVLTLMADRGIEIGGWIHDFTGYVSLVASAVLLGFTAKLLATLENPTNVSPTSLGERPRSAPLRGFTIGSVAATVIALFFVVKTQPAPAETASRSSLEALLPESYPGWHTQTDSSLYLFRATLKTEALLQRTYSRLNAEGETEQITVYLAHWAPGQASVSLVAAHTPDACWPGSGWNNATPQSLVPKATPSDLLPPGDYRYFSREDQVQYVWYWHLHRGRIVTDSNPFSPWKMAGLVLNHGITSTADQTFIRISSNRPCDRLKDEKLLQEIAQRLHSLGLDNSHAL
ncbi:MAG TPA: exosortase/archaeosortase family protein, partial [Opitutaceae bacterium]|nr:exosortase/archaeosortase family protein [Opitutaceae bacterium]